MRQLSPKKILVMLTFLFIGSGVLSLQNQTVHASTTAETKATAYCSKISGANDAATRLRAACHKGFVGGYDGKEKATVCTGTNKATCEDGFDAGKEAKAAAGGGVPGSVDPVADPCKDPKSVNPEAGCVKTGKVSLTNEDAKKAGLTPRSGDDIVAQTLNGVYSVVAIVAVIVIVLAGIRIITADGDSSKVAAARQTIIYAVVGLAVVGSAFIITGIVQGIGTK